MSDNSNQDLSPEPEAPAEDWDREVLREMKRLGMPKPQGCPNSLWAEPKELNHRHDEIMTLMLNGRSKKFIAEHIGMDYQYLITITNSPLFEQTYKELRAERNELPEKKRLHKLFGPALTVVEDVMSNVDEKGSVRLDAAKYVIDQSVGKSQQQIEVKGSILAEVIHSLDQLKSMRDVTGATSQPALDKPKTAADTFIEDFIPDNFAVGQRGTGEEKPE